VDASEERDRLAARPLAQERSRLFDQQAEAYDRFRPTYPDAVIDELLGPVPAGLDVLEVGCGTGIASRQMAQRGAKVLGVELAPRMAEIARGHGVEVEIAAFEGWEAAGRTFDRVTSAQAWHWLDPLIATAKAASVLRPGGRLGRSGTRVVSPMIWPMLLRWCTRVSCRAAATVCSGGMRPIGHPT
jgi:SAM-dependent methyltransferase